MAGLDATGFTPQTLNETREEINDALRSAFGQSIDLTDNSIFGRIVGIVAEELTLLWELGEAIFSSQDPDKATGAALEAIAALTGTIRDAAFPSAVVLTLTGTPAVIITAGNRARTASTNLLFETLVDAQLNPVDPWVGSTPYPVGKEATNVGNVYVAVIAGTSAASGGPTGTGTGIVDGTVTWDFLGVGTASANVDSASVDAAPIVGAARDITVIDTPVGGWSSVINQLDADVGSLVETDEDLRVRREFELTSIGAATLDAIHAFLLRVDGVTTVRVFMNVTNVTDVDGLPPKSVEALVQGGADQDIFDALLAVVAAGIETFGTTVGSAVDSQGTSHVQKFSRPTLKDIWVDVTLIKDPNNYPVNGDDAVKQAIVDYGDAQTTGKDVVSSALSSACFNVAGVLDVTSLLIGLAPSPSSNMTIPIDLRELAVYDTSRIVVSSSDGTP